MSEEAEVFVNESTDEVRCWRGNVEEKRLVEDDVWDDIEGMVREDDGEVALVDENERTVKGVEVVEELEEKASCELKDIDDMIMWSWKERWFVRRLSLGLKMRGFVEELRW